LAVVVVVVFVSVELEGLNDSRCGSGSKEDGVRVRWCAGDEDKRGVLVEVGVRSVVFDHEFEC
jgi:hypothetical protein